VDRAEIYCVQFSLDQGYLVVTSDKGTVHLFKLPQTSQDAQGRTTGQGTANAHSTLRFLGGYFQSEWSFAQLRIPDYRAIAGFGDGGNSLVVLCADGTYIKAKWDAVLGGEMVKIDQANFAEST
jgi:WD40 repeat protein